MKKLIFALMIATPFMMNAAHAATEQQNKMAACNKEAGDKKGDERKAFMKDCLSAKPKASAAQLAQHDKMKTCSAEAKGKTGDERKKFMSTCLKK
jgi:hypothetical protein